MSAVCKSLGIPHYLCKNGRSPLTYFGKNEFLLRRFNVKGRVKNFIDINTRQPIVKISNEIFQLNNDSYNRSIFCRVATDVLYNDRVVDNGAHYTSHGVLSISIGSIVGVISPLNQNGSIKHCELRPIHTPMECNYSHCELQYFVDGTLYESRPKSANTFFRRILIKRMNILKEVDFE
jgi:hypothetical protein